MPEHLWGMEILTSAADDTLTVVLFVNDQDFIIDPVVGALLAAAEAP